MESKRKKGSCFYFGALFSLLWMSVDNCSNRDFAISTIFPSSTFALRNWVVLASGLPSLYRVAAVDVCDIPSLSIHRTNGLGSIAYLKRPESSSFLPCRAICLSCRWFWPHLQKRTAIHVFIYTGTSFIRVYSCKYYLWLCERTTYVVWLIIIVLTQMTIKKAIKYRMQRRGELQRDVQDGANKVDRHVPGIQGESYA